MKRIILSLFALVAAGVATAQEESFQSAPSSISQTSNNVSDGRDDNKMNVFINVEARYNPWCDKKKVGVGCGLEAEWLLTRQIGIGTGLNYSTEYMSYHNNSFYWNNRNGKKFVYDVSFVNFPLRLYYHPSRQLAIDVGLQWSYMVSRVPVEDINRLSLSIPFGLSVSLSSKRSFRIGIQPRLSNTMEDDLDVTDDIDSSQLLIGFRVNIL